MKRSVRKRSAGDRFFYAINALFLTLLAIIIIYPLYFIIIASISDPDAVLGGQVFLYPVKITLEGFEKVFHRSDIWTGYLNTIWYTLVTVVLSLFLFLPAGWALSRKDTPGRKFWMVFFIIPMFFGGGLIPFYNVMSNLHLVNSAWAIILPAILSVWNLFMTKTFFESSIPEGLLEAARIDGASAFQSFRKITLPYMMFITGPYLLTSYIGNLNNFNIIFLLNKGQPKSMGLAKAAGSTDLLVTWLYKLTVNSSDFNLASVIGIIVFVVCAAGSLITFNMSKASKNEEEFS